MSKKTINQEWKFTITHIRPGKNGRIIFRRGEAGRNADPTASASGFKQSILRNMEVHAHTQTPRRKWTHYLFEFLMLFLAVFCGFLAEYQLEHKIEKDREKQYIKSFAEDLAFDISDLVGQIDVCSTNVIAADSLLLLLVHPQKEKFAGNIYYFFRFIHRHRPFTVNDRTIAQLRNAGGMRLVSNKTVSDSMISYYKDVDFIKWIYDEQTELKRSLRPHFDKILYAQDFGKVIDTANRVIRPTEALTLRAANEESLNTLMLILNNIKGINQGTRLRLAELKEKAHKIRQYVVKEYRLK